MSISACCRMASHLGPGCRGEQATCPGDTSRSSQLQCKVLEKALGSCQLSGAESGVC